MSKSGVSQKLDLEKITGVSLAGQRALRLAIAQKVIDHMVDRTRNKNVDVDGRAFKKYSEAYKKSTVFKLLKDGDVDMTLTGNMMGDLDVLSDDDQTIEIGLTDETEILKAFNHNTGDTVPKRQFFGITEKELKDIINTNFSDDIDAIKAGVESRPRTVADLFNEGLTRAADAVGRAVRTVADLDG